MLAWITDHLFVIWIPAVIKLLEIYSADLFEHFEFKFSFSLEKSHNLLVDEPNLKIIDPLHFPPNLVPNFFPENTTNFYFVARQSKSRRLFLFEAKALAQSNLNLVSTFFKFAFWIFSLHTSFSLPYKCHPLPFQQYSQ